MIRIIRQSWCIVIAINHPTPMKCAFNGEWDKESTISWLREIDKHDSGGGGGGDHSRLGGVSSGIISMG